MEKTTRKKICNYLKKLNNYKLKRNADRAEWKELFNYLKRLNKYKLERNEHYTKISYGKIVLLEIFENDEGISIMTEEQYGMYDEVFYLTNTQFVIFGRMGKKLTKWELDTDNNKFFHKK